MYLESKNAGCLFFLKRFMGRLPAEFGAAVRLNALSRSHQNDYSRHGRAWHKVLPLLVNYLQSAMAASVQCNAGNLCDISSLFI